VRTLVDRHHGKEAGVERFDPAQSFGAHVASRYDDWCVRGDEEAAALFLSQCAGGRRALEFAVGTGRIALPLAARGVVVDGIEFSPHMVERLLAKPGGQHIDVTIGDMSLATTGLRYGLVYLVYNTIFNLLTADDQIRCFENAARHLTEDGRFVVEAALPHAWINPADEGYVRAEHVGVDSVRLDVARYDAVTQLFEENHVEVSADGITLSPIVCRLITPGEMDLMARIAGLSLVERFANWQRAPFDAHSRSHVSVYALRAVPSLSASRETTGLAADLK
jgi:SAM-dependent methyltransferase